MEEFVVDVVFVVGMLTLPAQCSIRLGGERFDRSIFETNLEKFLEEFLEFVDYFFLNIVI